MTNNPPKLTDRAALTRHRARTADDALFLHEIAAEHLQEKLEVVNRSFTDIALITGLPEYWGKVFPGARLVADNEVLDLTPSAHDLVIHAMALHWADDPIGQLIQCRRALRPDGLFLSVSLGGATLSELRTSLAEAETRVAGGLSPRVAPMLELRDAGGLLQRAGLALPVADADRLTVSYADAFALMAELRAMGETNALHARDRRVPPRALFAEAGRIYQDSFLDEGDPDRIKATFELVHLSGWAPSADQPQPLRPGSARSRLADALGVTEEPLRDDSSPASD